MRRLLAGAVLTGALAVAAPAEAHTLSVSFARGETFRWARTMATAVQAAQWGVGDCRRINVHVVDCDWWDRVQGRNGGAIIRCDNVVRIRLGRFGVQREFPVIKCYVEGAGP